MTHPPLNPFATPETVQTGAELPVQDGRRSWSTLVTGLVAGVLLGGTFGALSAGLMGVLFCVLKTAEFQGGGDELVGTAFAIGSAGAFIGGFLGLATGALVGSLASVIAIWGSPQVIAKLPWVTAALTLFPAGGAGCLAGLLFGGFSSAPDLACVLLAIVIGLSAGGCGGFQLGIVVSRRTFPGFARPLAATFDSRRTECH